METFNKFPFNQNIPPSWKSRLKQFISTYEMTYELTPVLTIPIKWQEDPRIIWNDPTEERKYQSVLKTLLKRGEYKRFIKLTGTTILGYIHHQYLELTVRYGNLQTVRHISEYIEQIDGNFTGIQEGAFPNLLLNNTHVEVNRLLITHGMIPETWQISQSINLKQTKLADLFLNSLLELNYEVDFWIELYLLLRKLNYSRGIGIIFSKLPKKYRDEWTQKQNPDFVVY